MVSNLEFRQALEDGLCKNGAGPDFKRAVVRLMKHPNYRDAHGTDEHYMPTCFVAGLVGEEEDRDESVVLGAEVWELVSETIAASCLRPLVFVPVLVLGRVSSFLEIFLSDMLK